ncbi:hypothetical protein BDW22DRAFT_1431095 [Trametopsis cervina]|nr:hypothetical protein BDW22DRAFT_1431095 [Trametopsis cervina]
MGPDSETYGALLIGGIMATYLSGVVCTQTYLYFRSFPRDPSVIRSLVFVVWFMDILHSALVFTSVWHYLITGLKNPTEIQNIYWSVSGTISITGFTTFLIHCFFTHRVWTLSKQNKWITAPIMALAFLRMLSAFGTVAQMTRLHTWARFHEVAAWSFTTGLVISATVDILIAFTLVYYLSQNRTGFSNMDYILDTIMLYTVENGMLTSISVVASFICWLTMPQNFIFLAFHFIIFKMYANSFLATLNARRNLKDRSLQGGRRKNSIQLPTLFTSESLRRSHTSARKSKSRSRDSPTTTTLQINVEKSVHYATDVPPGTFGQLDLEALEPAYLAGGTRSSRDFESSFAVDTGASTPERMKVDVASLPESGIWSEACR